MKNTDPQPDYKKLRLILENQLGREVTIQEATGAGDYLLEVYGILLGNRGDHDTLEADTTYHT